jgi:hypothetical protein
VEITGDPNGPGAGNEITVDPVEITSDANKKRNADCKKQVDNDVQGCMDKANTACSILGASIAAIGGLAGAFFGPIGAGIGGVAGGVYGAKRYGDCLESVGKDCRAGADEAKEKCDDQFPLADS